jgi:peptide/nickel transport system substrate-binding protein
VSKAAVTKAGMKDMDLKPVGTGAFVFKAWEKDQKIVLEANKDHFRGRPHLDRVIMVVVRENAGRFEQLKAGKLHVIDGLTPATAKDVAAQKDLVLARQTGMNLGYLAFNCEKKPFDDPRVRRAVALAVDRKRIVELNYTGLGEAARNPMPPFVPGWDESAPDPKPDLEAAKKLLAEAGVTTPLEVELWHMPNPRPYMPEPLQTALVIQDDLKKIGIECKLVREEWKQHLAKTKKGAHQLCTLGWIGDTSDADNFLYILLAKDNIDATNVSRYADAEVNEKLRAAQTESDRTKRLAIYKEVQKKLREDMPLVPLVHADQLAATRANVKGFKLHPTGRREWKNVWLEK